jgi:hypothetical protein
MFNSLVMSVIGVWYISAKANSILFAYENGDLQNILHRGQHLRSLESAYGSD